MKVLIIGGGGREHAMAWATIASPRVEEVVVAPGNAGTALEPGVRNLQVGAGDVPALVHAARKEGVDFAVVGPEAPLVGGVVDAFEEVDIPCLGPRRDGAALEGSKAFAKDFMARHGIPTADHRTFNDAEAAEAHIRELGAPVVIKADGLASGKGVTVARHLDEALLTARSMLEGEAFGDAGRRIVVEQCLQGEEITFMALVDGEDVVALASSQDHKARDAGDQGPNTGGMGAYSPAPRVDDALHRRIMERVVQPTVRGLASEGIHYRGFLYAGLMVSDDGEVFVLEYNCRLGDPEAQPLLMRLRSDFAELCRAALEGRLAQQPLEWDPRAAVGVVLAAEGYPGVVRKGLPIHGLEEAKALGPDVRLFHSGTAFNEEGEVVTNGGRVLCACGLGDTVRTARDAAYHLADTLSWEGMFHRPDIGYRAL